MDIAAAKRGTSDRGLWNCSTPCTICRELKHTKQQAPIPQLQLAILAARLTTKIADNDALFRCNAELAQTNSRLQNEVDDLKEQVAKHITSSNTDTVPSSEKSLTQQQGFPKQSSNQSSGQKVIDTDEKEWTWEVEDYDVQLNDFQQFSSSQQLIGSTITDESQMASLGERKTKAEDVESLEKLSGTEEFSKECKQKEELEQEHHKLLKSEFNAGLGEQKLVVKMTLKEGEHEMKESDWISGLEEQVRCIPQDIAIKDGRMQILEELKGQVLQKETELRNFEKDNRSLNEQLKSQEQLIEDLKKELCMIKEYRIVLEEKNESMEQKIFDQKKEYEELMIEKKSLVVKAENEVRTKLHEEIILLKKKVSQLTKEKAKLADREIFLKELKEKLKHSQEKNIDIQRELDDCHAQIRDLQQMNEVDQGAHQQLVEAQKKITELERKLDQVVEQNELLKDGEQKLTNALMISNTQLAKMESKNGKLELEISSLHASFLKTEKVSKTMSHPEKLVMNETSAMIGEARKR